MVGDRHGGRTPARAKLTFSVAGAPRRAGVVAAHMHFREFSRSYKEINSTRALALRGL